MAGWKRKRSSTAPNGKRKAARSGIGKGNAGTTAMKLTASAAPNEKAPFKCGACGKGYDDNGLPWGGLLRQGPELGCPGGAFGFCRVLEEGATRARGVRDRLIDSM